MLRVTLPASWRGLLEVFRPAFRITGSGIGVALRALSSPLLAAVVASGAALLATDRLSSPIGKLVVAGLVGLIVYAAVTGPQLLQVFPSGLASKQILVFITTWPSLLAQQLRRAREKYICSRGRDQATTVTDMRE
jgi:hypothetical protein